MGPRLVYLNAARELVSNIVTEDAIEYHCATEPFPEIVQAIQISASGQHTIVVGGETGLVFVADPGDCRVRSPYTGHVEIRRW